MSPFTLGRMRHALLQGLLAYWHQLHPSSRTCDALRIARLSTGCLAAAILASPQ